MSILRHMHIPSWRYYLTMRNFDVVEYAENWFYYEKSQTIAYDDARLIDAWWNDER